MFPPLLRKYFCAIKESFLKWRSQNNKGKKLLIIQPPAHPAHSPCVKFCQQSPCTTVSNKQHYTSLISIICSLTRYWSWRCWAPPSCRGWWVTLTPRRCSGRGGTTSGESEQKRTNSLPLAKNFGRLYIRLISNVSECLIFTFELFLKVKRTRNTGYFSFWGAKCALHW